MLFDGESARIERSSVGQERQELERAEKTGRSFTGPRFKVVPFYICLVAALVALVWLPGVASAAGLLTPAGRQQSLSIESQNVGVTIDNGIAVTTVTQVFRNPEDRPLEALYTFPVPREASVSNFSMWIGGQEVIGEVLERERAREIYRQVTRVERRDPGLLEQVDFKTFEMRVFPVPARGTQRIQISYYQPVDYDSGIGTYVYPLEMDEQARTELDGEFSLTVDVKSDIALTKIDSPSHGEALVTAEVNERRFRASIEEAQGNLDRDFVLVYELARERMGMNVVASRRGDDDGYFMLIATPGPEFDDTSLPVNLVFVLDVSGSMRAVGKLDVARRAAAEAIRALDEGDSFNIIAFNIAPLALAAEPLPATEENRRRATEFLESLEGRGATDIALALAQSVTMQRPDAQNAIVLLSDGQATNDDDHGALSDALARLEPDTRVFSFGIGNEVNRPLLDRLARESGGLADYVSGQDDVERKVRLMSIKLASPVAENLELKVDGVEVYDLAPRRLPNLYRGQQLVVFGRYRGSGEAKINLSGTVLDREENFSAEGLFPSQYADHPQIERMWAWREVASRLALLQSGGPSKKLIDEIVTLGTEYSIVTPFTAFLVLENEAEYERFSIERKNAKRITAERAARTRQFAGPTDSVPDMRVAPRGRGGGGGGGGGSVEWLLLAGMGALGASRLMRRKRCSD